MIDWFGWDACDRFKVTQVFQESILKLIGFVWMNPETFVAFAE